jgi:hydroxyacylglutathione hydrolase
VVAAAKYAGKSGFFVQNGGKISIPDAGSSSTLSQILLARITMFAFAGCACPIVEVHFCESNNGNRYILPSSCPHEESSFVKQTDLQLATILSQPFEQNCYVARLRDRKDCVIIDPGLEPEKILRYLDQQGVTPAAILNTHGHSDHIAGNGAVKKRWPDCPLIIGAGDAAKLTDPWLNLSAGFGVPMVSPAADVLVQDGDSYEAAGFELQVRTIPGHSVGHVVYLWEGEEPPVVFVGDVIFAGSIGRTDFTDGDQRGLILGIRSKLFTLPDETILLPGHGGPTTVGEEKRNNPFAGMSVR